MRHGSASDEANAEPGAAPLTSMMALSRRILTLILAHVNRPALPRVALWLSLGIAWVNFVGTVKWAYLPGALNGWKRPWYGGALAAATLLSVIVPIRAERPVRLGRIGPAAAALGLGVLVVALFVSFPPSVWGQIPFLDDWPPRFQSTIDGIRLLERGAVVGWQWAFLGGYHTASNLGQSLSLLAFIPVEVFGPAFGFHLLHALMVLAIPALLYWDLRLDGSSDVAWLTAAFGGICSAGLFGTIVPSGDTNSIAGLVCALAALTASRAARVGRRWGGPLLIVALVLTAYSHVAFFLYAVVYLGLEVVYYRDFYGDPQPHRAQNARWGPGRAAAARTAVAIATAIVAALPLYWELLRYPAFTSGNNVLFDPTTPIPWTSLLLKLGYNVQMLTQPWRWFNDYGSLTCVFLPVYLVVALRARSLGGARAGFYAWAALVTIAMIRLDAPWFGYVFIRPIHMLAVFAPPVLAWFIVETSVNRALAVTLAIVVGLFVQSSYEPIPHLRDVRAFNPALVDHLAGLDGNLVLIENSPHRNMNATPGQRSVRPLIDTHFEALLPGATGRRFYGQEWDGWHWSRFRGQVMAGGAFRGRAIDATPIGEFDAEVRRWGVTHLVVWSDLAKEYLRRAGAGTFEARWSASPWVDFEYIGADADGRQIVALTGKGALRALDPLGANIDLEGVRAGETVVVRTNYYPAWRASADGSSVALFSADGQLAFAAPRDGSYRVRLDYPRHALVEATAGAGFLAGLLALAPLGRKRPRAGVVDGYRRTLDIAREAD
jgi:hypothetical protein